MQHQKRFVEHLAKLEIEGNRAALAALRRGLGKEPGASAESHRYVVPWLPRDTSPWEEEAYYLVAALFAWHPESWNSDESLHEGTNLGASFARLAETVEGDSIEKRFVALLNCHRDELPDHLRHVVGLLRSKEIPIDWAQLLYDILHWDWESRTVQRNWARAFWRRASAHENVSPEDETSTAEEGRESSEA